MLRWITTNWGWIAAGIVALCSVLNLITQHYGDNVKLKRVLLFVVDLLSLVVSRGAVAPAFEPRGLRLKLPAVQISPPTEAMLRAEQAGVKVVP